jgi:hypothetical protein
MAEKTALATICIQTWIGEDSSVQITESNDDCQVAAIVDLRFGRIVRFVGRQKEESVSISATETRGQLRLSGIFSCVMFQMRM